MLSPLHIVGILIFHLLKAVTNYDKALAVEPSATDTSDAISIVPDVLNRTT